MRFALSSLLALSLAGSASAASLDGIDWWKGDVQAAFDQAKTNNKPLFLYWGAVWCPPCNQIKKTIFTRREFQEKMSLFVPVYLDGDTEQAQLWGEKLNASGYPTMIVFDPQGRELTRLPGGLQLEQFNALLDQTLEQMKPMREVLDQALAAKSGNDVADSSYRLLAYYSWGQDNSVNLSSEESEKAFRELEAKIPARLAAEKARLFGHWFSAAVDLEREHKKNDEIAEKFTLTKAQLSAADTRMREILTNPELRLQSLELVSYYAGEVVNTLWPKPSPQRTSLIKLWEKAAGAIEDDSALSVDERLSALIPQLEFHQMERKGDVPQIFKEHVSKRVKWARQNSDDAFTRQAAMSTAGWLLRQVGLIDEAKDLYQEQLKLAISPHYFMSSLSTLARKDGNTDEAIGWMRQAYETAEGRATRFQWGTSYLMGLMDLAPQKASEIQSETVRVFKELLTGDDAFAGRNKSRINRLKKSYAEWAGTKRASQRSVKAISKELAPSCETLSSTASDDGESMQSRCTDFFQNLGQKS